MKIADGIEMLELDMNFMGNVSTIHPTLLYDDRRAVLVDVGMPGQLSALQAAMDQAGVPFERIDTIILTHQDIDHIGGIEDVRKALDHPVDVLAHAEDKPYIEGEKEPIKMTRERITQMLARLPEEMRAHAEALFAHPPTAKVTKTVADGDVLPIFGGLQVIFTPGHTPGHISLYHRASKTLITGDATTAKDGKIMGPSPQATPDMDLACASHRKFGDFAIAQAICYHGGLCSEQVTEQFRSWTRD